MSQLDDVAGVAFSAVTFPAAPDTPTLVLKNVIDLAIQNSPGLPETNRAGLIADERL